MKLRANYVACCVCLNLQGDRIPMVTIVKGYAVCEEHIQLVSAPGFDIFRLRSDSPRHRSV